MPTRTRSSQFLKICRSTTQSKSVSTIYGIYKQCIQCYICSLNSKIASLASRLVSSNNSRDRDGDDEDEDALFAELEAEIENDSNSAMREHGLAVLKQESVIHLLPIMSWLNSAYKDGES